MESKNPVIAVDIDDVIAANAASFVAYSNEKWGTHLTVDDYQDHWSEMWGIEHAESEKRYREFHESGHIGTYEEIHGAKEVLQKLKERFTLIILTARPASVSRLTNERLDTHFRGIFDSIICAGFYDGGTPEDYKLTKGELAKNINAKYIIDDQPRHVLAASELGIRGILFGEYAWNKADALPKNVTRVTNWDEVLQYFDTK